MGDPLQGADLRVEPALLGDDKAILEFVLRQAGNGPAIVAVDAPLRVPNPSGRRPAEAMLHKAFHAYEAGAHPANRRLLDRGEGVRGENLVTVLAAHGFRFSDRIDAGTSERLVVEVFPHPAMVALFGLERTLKYKARRGRTADLRMAEWRRYQGYLRGLAAVDPPLRGLETFVTTELEGLRGSRLKAYEDRADALLCAYVALYGHRWGAARCCVFGDMETGAIFTPVPWE